MIKKLIFLLIFCGTAFGGVVSVDVDLFQLPSTTTATAGAQLCLGQPRSHIIAEEGQIGDTSANVVVAVPGWAGVNPTYRDLFYSGNLDSSNMWPSNYNMIPDGSSHMSLNSYNDTVYVVTDSLLRIIDASGTSLSQIYVDTIHGYPTYCVTRGAVIRIPGTDTLIWVNRGNGYSYTYGHIYQQLDMTYFISGDLGQTWSDSIFIWPMIDSHGNTRFAAVPYNGSVWIFIDSSEMVGRSYVYNRTTHTCVQDGNEVFRNGSTVLTRGFCSNWTVINGDTTQFIVIGNLLAADGDSIYTFRKLSGSTSWTQSELKVDDGTYSLTADYVNTALTRVEEGNLMVMFYWRKKTADSTFLYCKYWDESTSNWSTLETQVSDCGIYQGAGFNSVFTVPTSHGSVAYCMYEKWNGVSWVIYLARVNFTLSEEETTTIKHRRRINIKSIGI